ncbi:MAG: hypothetical protein NUW23_14430 [Firmicutes bacterium]|jgi:hypothetical protein|nr:hypothetical protein [Bacillota bacterium]
MAVDGRVLADILEELREMNRSRKENIRALTQIAQYLSDCQGIVDFAVSDSRGKHGRLMQELKVQCAKPAHLAAVAGLEGLRTNIKLISSESTPVYTQDKSYLLRQAENSAAGREFRLRPTNHKQDLLPDRVPGRSQYHRIP